MGRAIKHLTKTNKDKCEATPMLDMYKHKYYILRRKSMIYFVKWALKTKTIIDTRTLKVLSKLSSSPVELLSSEAGL